MRLTTTVIRSLGTTGSIASAAVHDGDGAGSDD